MAQRLPVPNLTLARERPDSHDAVALIAELEAILIPLSPPASRHGLSVEQLIAQQVLFYVLRVDNMAAACGGIKVFDGEYAEVKRMYVRPAFRGQGCARRVLAHLASEARARGAGVLRLETGLNQVEAIALYASSGFYRIPPFGAYRPDPHSLFFEKSIA